MFHFGSYGIYLLTKVVIHSHNWSLRLGKNEMKLFSLMLFLVPRSWQIWSSSLRLEQGFTSIHFIKDYSNEELLSEQIWKVNTG